MAPQPLQQTPIRTKLIELRREERERVRLNASRALPRKRVEFVLEGAALAVALSSDGQSLAVGSSDKTATIFDVPSSRKLETFRFGSKVTSLMWSSNDAVVVVGLHEPSNKAVIIEIRRPPADDKEEEEEEEEEASTSYEFNPDALVAPFLDQVDSSSGPVKTVAWSKNDEYLALGTNGKQARIVKCVIEDNRVSKFFPESHQKIQCGADVMAVAWSGTPVTSTRAPLADWKYDETVARLAVGSYDQSVRIVEVSLGPTTLELLKERRVTFSGGVFAVAWSSNDLHLAVGSMGGSVSVIDVISCETMYKIKRDVGVMTGEHASRGKYLN